MKIGIIGSGNVGGTLGKRWARNGHQVIFSTRDGQSDEIRKLLAEAGPNAKSGSVAEAARESEIVVLATPWDAAENALSGAGNLSGKILIDATNPLLPDMSGLTLGTTTSAGEQVARWAPGAKVVKAFNTVGFNIMADPKFAGGQTAMLYCGDDANAKKTVSGLIQELGFDPIDVGPLTRSRLIEPFALLWITLAYPAGYGREIAFHFLRSRDAKASAPQEFAQSHSR